MQRMARMILSRNKNHSGFTLLELLIAVSLLSFGLLATATMQGVALNPSSAVEKPKFLYIS
jgi:prepilin-type N-terminal cleavage/methylation domain-containing protein